MKKGRGKTIIGRIVLVVLAGIIILLSGAAYLVLNEYKPDDFEIVGTKGTATKTLQVGNEVNLLSFNIGYGGLDSTQDFFMDGGKGVRPDSKDVITNNLEGIQSILEAKEYDIIMLQEVDKDSKRSYGVDQVEFFADSFPGISSFAMNFNCVYVPIPFPEMMGKVKAGQQILSRFSSSESSRIALPTPFTWPTRVCQLKRCLLVQRIPVEGSDKELVIVNLHLEAYDDGSGKEAQTKILMDFIEGERTKDNYIIAGGDFNQTFPGISKDVFPVYSDDYFVAGTMEESSLPEGFTFYADDSAPSARLLNQPYHPEDKENQYYVIDGFIISDNISVETMKTLDQGFLFSDHNPVFLSCKLK